jgi:hypothetical protein
MTLKKDSYIPALRVPADFAERARHACASLSVDPPEIRREWWDDLIRVSNSGEHLVRPCRIATTEMVTAIAESSSPDDIERLFHPPRQFKMIRVVAQISAAAAIAVACFFCGQLTDHLQNAGYVKRSAIPHGLSLVLPSVVPKIAMPILEPIDPVPAPTPTPQIAEVQPTPNAPSVSAPATPSKESAPSIREPEIKRAHVSFLASVTKDEAVRRAELKWNRRENAINRQLVAIDSEISRAMALSVKAGLLEREGVLKSTRDYIQKSRKYYRDSTRVAWDKAHGEPSFLDNVFAIMGL